MSYTKRERLAAIADGEPADRPLVSAWHHFLHEEADPEAFICASLAFQKKFDWDLVKLHPRAVYLAEAMGNRYDYSSYTGPMPKCVEHVINREDDLRKITRKPGDKGSLGEQLDIIRRVRAALGTDVPIIQTVFSPLAVFIHLAGAKNPGRNKLADSNENLAIRCMRNDPEGAHMALSAITDTMSDYVKLVLDAGADGLFYTPLGLAREGYLTHEEWHTFGCEYDLAVLEVARGSFNILHTCGMHANPLLFIHYPISVLYWAQSAPGNPPMAGSEKWLGKLGVAGGVNEELFASDNAPAIALAAAEACRNMRDKPFLLAPECSVSPTTPDNELMLLRKTVEQN